jgi:4a-hydroxytetrahydrobiopterin dehydratase
MTTLSLDALRAAYSLPQEGGQALDDAAIAAQLAALPAWSYRDGAIRREYRFNDYYETIAFVNAAAWIIHREDHHPDLTVSYNRVGVAFNTHSVNGISINDFISAAKLDMVFDR